MSKILVDTAVTTPSNKIPIAGPSITEREIAYVADAARTGWYSTANVYIDKFEQAVARYTRRKFAISLPSCTSGLHLALAAGDIKQGDEVIVPDCTWIASVAPVSYVGAELAFADIDPVTWCLDPASVRRAITPRTRAIIAVDLYGGMPNLAALEAIATEHDLLLIEDAAEAIGSWVADRPAGNFGDASVFSFHGSKTVTTGEGGMLVTDDPVLFERCGVLRDHGRTPGDKYFFNQEVGFKYKMSALQAALGLAQIERIDELMLRKREIFRWYQEALAGLGLTLNAQPEGTLNSYWMVTAVFPPEFKMGKREIIGALADRGIDTRPFFHPLTMLPAYANHPQSKSGRQSNPVSYSISERAINLPSALSLDREAVDRVVTAVRSLF
jgi:perosamine synthetase